MEIDQEAGFCRVLQRRTQVLTLFGMICGGVDLAVFR